MSVVIPNRPAAPRRLSGRRFAHDRRHAMASLVAITSQTRPAAETELRAPGAVLLVSCYELGHQPLALASAAATLREAGLAPAVRDLAVEDLTDDDLARARLVAVSVPMHTAMRLGQRVLDRLRQ